MRLTAEKLAGERGGERIFSDVGFTLEAGEALIVTGPNGAGKSTLLRVVAGLLPVAAGALRIEGGRENWPAPAASCHYLGHQNAMKTALSVRENLEFWQAFNGEPRSGVTEALAEVGLAGIAHLPFGYLSTGQKRRVSLARLLVSHRPVCLLDDPTAGLDKASDARVGELIGRHRAAGGSRRAATHLPLGVDDPT